MANLQLVAPLVSLTIDTKSFCQPLLRTKPVLVLVLVYHVLSYIAVLVRPDQSINLLHLYNFAQSFRLQFAGVAAASTLVYVSSVYGTRQMLGKCWQRRLQPV